jgi:hypothetical protein
MRKSQVAAAGAAVRELAHKSAAFPMPDGRIGRRLPALPAASASSMTDGCVHKPIGARIAGTPVLAS